MRVKVSSEDGNPVHNPTPYHNWRLAAKMLFAMDFRALLITMLCRMGTQATGWVKRTRCDLPFVLLGFAQEFPDDMKDAVYRAEIKSKLEIAVDVESAVELWLSLQLKHGQ
jgi:hypothetical protein